REILDRRLGGDLAAHGVDVLELHRIPRRGRDGGDAGIVPAQMLLMPVDGMRFILIMCRMVHRRMSWWRGASLTCRARQRPQPNVSAGRPRSADCVLRNRPRGRLL